MLLSDYYFMSDYRLAQYRDPLGSFLSLPTEAISQLYLTGVGNRSFFDARTIYYLSFSGNQDKVPVIHPVIDYSNVINSPIFGGEVSYKTNFTSLSRSTAAFDPITTLANTNGLCLNGRSAGAETFAVPAARHARHLHAGSPPKRSGANRSPIRPARSGRRSRSCAPTPSTPRFRTSRAFRISFPSAIPTHCV